MKTSSRTFLSIVCALFFWAACEMREPRNEAATGPESNRTISANATVAANDSENVKPTPTPTPGKSPVDARTEFTGTTGVTDKKREIRETAVLREVRTAAQDGYDRVVFEFAGAELPGYHIEYIDKPVRQCGSGDTVSLKGDGWLEIRFSRAQAHDEQGKPTVKTRELRPNHKIIKELKSTCDFEAEVEWVLGVAAPNPYRVLELKNPTRLAIDVKH